jgi:hypothetical protein
MTHDPCLDAIVPHPERQQTGEAATEAQEDIWAGVPILSIEEFVGNWPWRGVDLTPDVTREELEQTWKRLLEQRREGGAQ